MAGDAGWSNLHRGMVGHQYSLVHGTRKALSYPVVNTPTMPELKRLGHKSFYRRHRLSRNNLNPQNTGSYF